MTKLVGFETSKKEEDVTVSGNVQNLEEISKKQVVASQEEETASKTEDKTSKKIEDTSKKFEATSKRNEDEREKQDETSEKHEITSKIEESESKQEMEDVNNINVDEKTSTVNKCNQDSIVNFKENEINHSDQQEIQNAPDTSGKFNCPECSVPFYYQADLWMHMKSSHDELINLPGSNIDPQLLISLMAEQNVDINAGVKGMNKTIGILDKKFQKYLVIILKFMRAISAELTSSKNENSQLECNYCHRKCKSIANL